MMIRTSFFGPNVFTLLIGLVILQVPVTEGALTPGDIWTYDWETYVDLQPGNSNVASTNWDFSTHKWEEVYVDGDGIDNVGDDDEHQGEAAEAFGDEYNAELDELTMTLSGLVPNTSYSIDAVVMSESGNDSDEWGITAGFSSSVWEQKNYDCVNREAAHVNRGFNDEWLARIPMGTTTSDGNGEITVHINQNPNLDWEGDSQAGSVVDGLIYRKESDIAAPRPSLFASVNRKNGATDNDLSIGIHDGEADPLPAGDYGLQLGAQGFSDRVYHFDDISEALVGADYVRTLLNDKSDAEGDFSYDVELTSSRDEVFLMVLLDDRFEDSETPESEMQATVDTIVAAFADPGEFVATGLYVDLSDSSDPHPLTAYGMMAPTKDQYGTPITYTFGATPIGAKSTYMIAALEEAPQTTQVPGDTNGDSIVDETDAQVLASGWGSSTEDGASAGDFNGDKIVDVLDAAILAANWGDHTGSEGTATVPEPGVLAMLATALLGLAIRRRR